MLYNDVLRVLVHQNRNRAPLLQKYKASYILQHAISSLGDI